MVKYRPSSFGTSSQSTPLDRMTRRISAGTPTGSYVSPERRRGGRDRMTLPEDGHLVGCTRGRSHSGRSLRCARTRLPARLPSRSSLAASWLAGPRLDRSRRPEAGPGRREAPRPGAGSDRRLRTSRPRAGTPPTVRRAGYGIRSAKINPRLLAPHHDRLRAKVDAVRRSAAPSKSTPWRRAADVAHDRHPAPGLLGRQGPPLYAGGLIPPGSHEPLAMPRSVSRDARDASVVASTVACINANSEDRRIA